jgi:hypothetical protein
MTASAAKHRAAVREGKDSMDKFVFVTLMTWSGLTAAAGLAPGPGPGPGGPAYAGQAPAVTWTCAHNVYRSVVCR